MTSGIYKIVLITTGRVYVGSSLNMERRHRQHWADLSAGRHRNRHLQAAWSKYGSSVFTFSIIEEVPIDCLDAAERKWIKSLQAPSRLGGFNISEEPWFPGYLMSAEHRAAISTARRGMKFTDQHRANMSKARIGVTTHVTPEAITARRNGLKAWHEKNGHSQDTKSKIGNTVRQQQHANPSNKWGVPGVVFINSAKKRPWRVTLKDAGRTVYIGAFASLDEAASASAKFAGQFQ